jgi:mediator of RNA polymerase II transcription subunit 17
MLEQIIKQARHFVVRQRTLKIIDKLAEEITDLQIASHWCNLSSAIESMVKVNITFNGYETVK